MFRCLFGKYAVGYHSHHQESMTCPTSWDVLGNSVRWPWKPSCTKGCPHVRHRGAETFQSILSWNFMLHSCTIKY